MMRPVSARSVCSSGVCAVDGDRFFDDADFQLEIDAHRGVDVDLDALADRLLEPAQLGFNPVDAVPAA